MAYELFADSFDTANTLSDGKWPTRVGTTFGISVGRGRRSTNALRCTPTSGTDNCVQTKELTPSSYAVCGFSYESESTPYTNVAISFQNQSSILTLLNIMPSGKFSLILGSNTYVSNNALNFQATNYIEVGTIIANSGFFEVRVNGSNTGWLSLSNVDTQPSTTNTSSCVRITVVRNSTTFNTYIDDFYVTYGNELKWLGDVRIDAMPLDGNATPQDWVPDTGNAWQRLLQPSGNVRSNTINAESLFSVSNISTFDVVTVHGVQIVTNVDKTDAGFRSIVIEANNSNITTNSNPIYLGTANGEYTYSMLKDTDGNNWTKEKFNTLNVGMKIIG